MCLSFLRLSPVVTRNPDRVSPLAPWGERTGDDEAYSAVFAAVVTVFVLLVVRVSIVSQSSWGPIRRAQGVQQHTKAAPSSRDFVKGRPPPRPRAESGGKPCRASGGRAARRRTARRH